MEDKAPPGYRFLADHETVRVGDWFSRNGNLRVLVGCRSLGMTVGNEAWRYLNSPIVRKVRTVGCVPGYRWADEGEHAIFFQNRERKITCDMTFGEPGMLNLGLDRIGYVMPLDMASSGPLDDTEDTCAPDRPLKERGPSAVASVVGIGLSAPRPCVLAQDMSGDDVGVDLTPEELAAWNRSHT